MEILAFLIIAGVWAVFLLPAFFESSKSASLRSTRSFARNNDLLASVTRQTTQQVIAVNSARRRRRRSVAMLGSGALGSLGAAVITGSLLWLGITIVFDILLAGFVVALLQAKAVRFRPVAAVGPIDLAEPVEEYPGIEIVPTIRIVGA